MKQVLLLLLALISALSPALGAESRPVTKDHSVSRLVAEKNSIAPGETVTLLLSQDLEEHWHVYWKNPGDSGLPLEMDWTLPPGFEAGPITYPMPQRYFIDPMVNYGFEGSPGFLIDITAPASVEPGRTVDLQVRAEWLICELLCVPEFADLTLSLLITETPGAPDPKWVKRFDVVRARQPEQGTFEAVYFQHDGKPAIEIKNQNLGDQLYFFSEEPNLIEPSAPQTLTRTQEGNPVLLLEPAYGVNPEKITGLGGLLEITPGVGYTLNVAAGIAPRLVAPVGPKAVQQGADDRESGSLESGSLESGYPAATDNSGGFWGFLLLAFLGGIILNIMPCVFPVIFIKAASLAKSAEKSPEAVRRHGLLYTAGVLVAFVAIAGLLLLLRAGGAELGWGFQLQYPGPNAVFALIIFLIGLNLAGLFEIGTSLQGVGSQLTAQSGDAGSFFTGLLAVAVAAPCIGPLLGPPVGFALNPGNSPLIGMAIFLVMGLGLAFPYVLISFVPGLSTLLPKPGPWMQTFKQLLSFAMFATLVWLVWVIVGQAGDGAVITLGIALLLGAFAAWGYGKWQRGEGAFWRALAVIALIGGFLMGATLKPMQRDAASSEERAPALGYAKLSPQAWSEEKQNALRAEGTPFFIDFTAKWCVTCQVNKLTVLQRPDVVDLFQDKGVAMLVADWTSYDPAITRALQGYGRSGVPLYVYYAPGAEQGLVLPQVLSAELLEKTFQ